MPDEKTFRRRRAVFLLLVFGALVLLTGSFVGAFGGTERGFAGIFSPLQEGVAKVAKPGRDLVNWVGDTFRAKQDLAKITDERDALRLKLGQVQGQLSDADQLNRFAQSSQSYGPLDQYGPKTAHVIGQTSNAWYRHVIIDVGTGDGVAVKNAVVGPDGLVGTVIRASGGTAVVRLITDPQSGVTAKVVNGRDRRGLRGPLVPSKIGAPGDLLLQIAKTELHRRGDQVLTAGVISQRLEGRFPPNIPIGVVSRIDDPGTDSQVVHVKAFADMRRLDRVWVLTASGSRAS
ncbi:MAG: rod shape-determining protein MreC [Patulibacter sp.]